jgi:hypothetical protein
VLDFLVLFLDVLFLLAVLRGFLAFVSVAATVLHSTSIGGSSFGYSVTICCTSSLFPVVSSVGVEFSTGASGSWVGSVYDLNVGVGSVSDSFVLSLRAQNAITPTSASRPNRIIPTAMAGMFISIMLDYSFGLENLSFSSFSFGLI